MRIAIHVEKGGTGKSSTAGTLGKLLSKESKTILVDADGQGNLSLWLGPEKPKFELVDVLTGQVEALEAIVKIDDNLSIIPTKKDLQSQGVTAGDLKTFSIRICDRDREKLENHFKDRGLKTGQGIRMIIRDYINGL